MAAFIFRPKRMPPNLHWESVFRRTRRRGLVLGFSLRRCRPGSLAHADLGDFYTVDVKTREVKATHVRLEAIAVALDVIAPGERIIYPEQASAT